MLLKLKSEGIISAASVLKTGLQTDLLCYKGRISYLKKLASIS